MDLNYVVILYYSQIISNVPMGLIFVTRFAETQQGVTHVAATLDTLWTEMDAHAVVR